MVARGDTYYVRSFTTQNIPRIRIREVLRSEVEGDLTSGVVLYSYGDEEQLYACSGNAFQNAQTRTGQKRFITSSEKEEAESTGK